MAGSSGPFSASSTVVILITFLADGGGGGEMASVCQQEPTGRKGEKELVQ